MRDVSGVELREAGVLFFFWACQIPAGPPIHQTYALQICKDDLIKYQSSGNISLSAALYGTYPMSKISYAISMHK